MADIETAIDEWASREFAPWQRSTLDRGIVEQRVRALTAAYPGMCLFRIEHGAVDFDPSIARMHPQCLDTATPIGQRSAYYRGLLRDAVRMFAVRGSALVAVYLNDLYLDASDAPVLFFQKPRGARGILLPDIDFLIENHYADDAGDFHDPIAFADKQRSAIFVGSTTGDFVLTSDDVGRRRNARIRAAMAFRDEPDVTFTLPNIVQVDNAATRDLIESLGIAGARIGWPEQFRHRYLLSMDGNGATCSRVALALASNSVLAKYRSDNDLHYFQGLEAWRDYIPIRADRDVIDLIAEADTFGALHAEIAERSSAFAHKYLSRISVLRYTAAILSGYVRLFGSGEGTPLAPVDPLLIDSAARVHGMGTIWTDPGQWSGASAGDPIEGFNLFAGPALSKRALRYRGVHADGTLTPVWEGQFCRSRASGVALHGIGVQLSQEAATTYRVEGQVRFADGSVARIDGRTPPTPHAAPMTGFRLRIRPMAWTEIRSRVRSLRSPRSSLALGSR